MLDMWWSIDGLVSEGTPSKWEMKGDEVDHDCDEIIVQRGISGDAGRSDE